MYFGSTYYHLKTYIFYAMDESMKDKNGQKLKKKKIQNIYRVLYIIKFFFFCNKKLYNLFHQ